MTKDFRFVLLSPYTVTDNILEHIKVEPRELPVAIENLFFAGRASGKGVGVLLACHGHSCGSTRSPPTILAIGINTSIDGGLTPHAVTGGEVELVREAVVLSTEAVVVVLDTSVVEVSVVLRSIKPTKSDQHTKRTESPRSTYHHFDKLQRLHGQFYNWRYSNHRVYNPPEMPRLHDIVYYLKHTVCRYEETHRL